MIRCQLIGTEDRTSILTIACCFESQFLVAKHAIPFILLYLPWPLSNVITFLLHYVNRQPADNTKSILRYNFKDEHKTSSFVAIRCNIACFQFMIKWTLA